MFQELIDAAFDGFSPHQNFSRKRKRDEDEETMRNTILSLILTGTEPHELIPPPYDDNDYTIDNSPAKCIDNRFVLSEWRNGTKLFVR